MDMLIEGSTYKYLSLSLSLSLSHTHTHTSIVRQENLKQGKLALA